MLKESDETQGQKLLKQLREEYKRSEKFRPEESPLGAASLESHDWPVDIRHSLNEILH